MPERPAGPRMISVAGDGLFSPVLDSQVVVPLAVLGRIAPHVRRALLVLTSRRHNRHPRLAERKANVEHAVAGAQAFLWDRWPLGTPWEAHHWARRLRTALDAAGYTGPQPIIVHCRGFGAGAAAALLKRRDPRLRILLDARGAPTDEVLAPGLLGWWQRRVASKALRAAIGAADALNTVSTVLAAHLEEFGRFRPGIPRTVIGCCADTQRFYFDPAVRARRRAELGLDGRFVVCYCGAMSHWQRPDALAAAFAAIAAAMPDAHLLIVSREAEPLVDQLRLAGVAPERWTARSARHEEVASYLMAADVGLLLRENTLTNRVASPVKFTEYLRCGLPVILTPYIGDFSGFAARHGVGLAIEFPVRPAEAVAAARQLRERLAAEGDAYRARCSAVAGEHFSWDAQIRQLVDVYERLAAT